MKEDVGCDTFIKKLPELSITVRQCVNCGAEYDLRNPSSFIRLRGNEWPDVGRGLCNTCGLNKEIAMKWNACITF